jgi:hypothetical protein
VLPPRQPQASVLWQRLRLWGGVLDGAFFCLGSGQLFGGLHVCRTLLVL